MPAIRQINANTRKIGCDWFFAIGASLKTGWVVLADSSLWIIGYSIIFVSDEQQPVWHDDPSFLQEQSPPQQLFFSSYSATFYWVLEESLSSLFNLSSISLSFFSLSFKSLAYFLLLIFSFSATISCFIRSTYLGSIGSGGGFSSMIYPSMCHSKALVIFMMTYLLNTAVSTRGVPIDREGSLLCSFWCVRPNRSTLCKFKTR